MKKVDPHILADRGVIAVRGARQNNLRGIDLDVPLGKLNVITGPSGSGKSSLAFDTIYAEGQRRYVETFSPYTRQFLERMDKPRVDSISGIPPAIAIEQANPVKSTRSTVGTMTEINDYLKCLMARMADAFCPSCGRAIRCETVQSIVDQLFSNHRGEPLLVIFSVPAPSGTSPKEFFAFLQQQGYLRIWLDGALCRTDSAPQLTRLPPLVRVVQDRVKVEEANRARLCDALETALRFGKGTVTCLGGARATDLEEIPFSAGWHCAHCDLHIAAPTPALFSFNHPLGACPRCRGFGRTIGIDYERAVPDRTRSLEAGAIKAFQGENGRECQRDLLRSARRREIDIRAPFEELPKSDQDWVIYGDDPKAPAAELWENDRWYGVRGFFEWLESKAYKMHIRVLLSRYRSYTQCPDCRGGRYQPATLNFRLGGYRLPEIMALPIDQLLALIAGLPPRGDAAAETVRREIEARLRYLVEVGLDYLTLDRSTRGLSGGEIERVNLTTCLGASLVNTLFVLDEPSVGLHPRDTSRLIRVMQNLRDKGNTLVVVEHEEAVIRAADHLIELGPGRGAAGGTLVYGGPFPAALKGAGTSSAANNGRSMDGPSAEQQGGTALQSPPRSLTFDYLSGRRQIAVPKRRREPRHFLTVREAAEHNLCKIDVQIPLGVFACVTGVSGSGKSTLVHDVLFRNLQLAKGIAPEEAPGLCKSLLGVEQVDQVVMVDQSPLARTPRSSPALYLGVFDAIRELFAMTADARARGLSASAFSFNSGTGRCERCCGNGFEKIEMQFLSDVFVRCPECEGKRYQPHVLTIQLHGKSIHDVLQMTVQEAVAFFAEIGAPRVTERLRVLEEVGLGYLTLGQPLNVLSGGESQRLKLVERLTSRGEKNALLILDEPTTGLHFDDIAQLLRVFDRLVEQGNSLLVIEHNLDVIKCADYVIDLGPEAGTRGGRVVATGTPEKIAGDRESHTGRYLARHLRAGEVGAEWTEIEDDRGLARVAEDAPSPHRAASAALLADPVDSNGRNCIVVRGAREHNLQNIDLSIPRDEMVIITGPSGSGKSTLAFDILFAEGQRRFLDSMSVYARQFVQQLEKPDVDSISGLPPSVAIEQRITRGGGKSTVATVTEVYHFLRLLFAKLGIQHCPRCDLPVERQSVETMARRCEALARKGRIRVLAPLVKARKGFHTDVARWAVRNGFDHLLVDGRLVAATAFPKLERFREHSIDVVVGERGSPARVRELLKRSLEIGKGTAHVLDAAGALHVLSLEMSCPGCGQSFEPLDPRVFSFNSPHGWCPECRGFGEIWHSSENPRLESALEIEMDEERQHEWLDEGDAEPCTSCGGSRLNPIGRHVRLNGTRMEDVAGMAAQRALEWIGKLRFRGAQQVIAADILPEVAQRLHFMTDVGLDYLALNRGAKTLSGGESQRIRLAAQLGSNLRGVLYVLDEPTIGLHPRDNVRLLDTLAALKANGNSLIIVEHDEETMRRADTIIDLGPAAGRGGGRVVAQGSIEAVCREEHSATGRCLREPLNHPTRGSRRPLDSNVSWLALEGATIHNLKQCDVQFPIGRFTAITGISGSGKSSLMRGTLKPLIEEHLRRPRKERVPKRGRAGARREAGASKTEGSDAPSLSVRPAQMVLPLASKNAGGTSAAAAPRIVDFVEAIYEVDQSPIGKTSRSTPATYIKVFDEIRKLFAQVPLARMRGYSASRFSFNTEGGRCETCAGQGVVKVEMAFLPTSYIPCEQCRGKRYNAATLEVLWNEKSIGDVMEMPVAVAANLFRAVPKVHRSLQLLCETGLGYLTLGQPSPTLSGGEAQRLKLVTELTRGAGRASHAILRQQRRAKSIVYLLEEPTIGLHMADVEELLKVLHRLVDEGHTVVVIEHNLSLIADADYVVDIGPEAGEQGGEVVATGTPEAVAKSKRSRTAPFLREILGLEQAPRSAKKKACAQLV